MTNPMAERPLDVDGMSPDGDDVSIPQIDDQLDDDPEAQPSLPDVDPGATQVEGTVAEPTDDSGADRLAPPS